MAYRYLFYTIKRFFFPFWLILEQCGRFDEILRNPGLQIQNRDCIELMT